jgi:hypothetical protein
MWPIYESRRVRQFIGGKWGHVTGLLWGKKWIRLTGHPVMWDENWDIPQNCIRYRQYIFTISDGGTLLRMDLFDPTETWQAIVKL